LPFVTGKSRVPKPAAGITALLTIPSFERIFSSPFPFIPAYLNTQACFGSSKIIIPKENSSRGFFYP